jgi:alpha-tubulin suppressor-like RCC1 family protein
MVSLFNSAGSTHLIADVEGWFADGSGFAPVLPARLLDTRRGGGTIDGLGAPGVPVGADGVLDLKVLGRGGVPAVGVGSVVLNVTAVDPSSAGFVTVWPAGSPKPTASNLNFPAGDTRPNLVVVRVGAGGMVSLFNSAGSTHLIGDVEGWFPEPSTATAVSTSDTHSCAVRSDGSVACWGDSRPERTSLAGQPPASYGPTTIQGVFGAADVAVGFAHACAVEIDLRVVCWGNNTFGSLGRGTTGQGDLRAEAVAGLDNAVAIEAGGYQTCVVRTNGRVACWGKDSAGANHILPYDIGGISDAKSLSVGLNVACAVRVTGGVACWGTNFSGELGNGGGPDSPVTAVQVSGITTALGVSAGGMHACAVITSTEVRCWGNGGDGQLGNGFGPLANSASPVVVVSAFGPGNLSGAVSIAAGRVATCVALASGGVACWGRNNQGMLGIGTPAGIGDPANYAVTQASTGVASVGGGGYHTCAVRNDRHLQCWGPNENQQIGDGSTTTALEPIAVQTFV